VHNSDRGAVYASLALSQRLVDQPFIWRAEAHEILAKVRRGREALNSNVKPVSDF